MRKRPSGANAITNKVKNSGDRTDEIDTHGRASAAKSAGPGLCNKEDLMPSYARVFSIRSLFAALVLTIVAGAMGCADGEFRLGDPFDRQLTFTESQHRYTTFVRWAEFQKARAFVADDNRAAYMEQMKSLKQARFIDYEAEPIELDTARQSATIRVTYTLYTASIPYEFEIVELQEWTREGISNDWRVYSVFEGLERLASN